MRTTQDVLTALSTNLVPVRRQASPLIRTLLWLALAVLVIGLLAMGHGLRPNLFMRAAEWPFQLEVIGALLTGVLAAFAAFASGIPGRSKWWIALPLPALALWMATIGQQCLSNWIVIGPAGMSLGESAECLATVGLTSLPLSLALVVMLRHAVVMRPLASYLLGSLAVAGIAGAAMSLMHALDASVMIVLFNVVSTLVIMGVATLLSTFRNHKAAAPSW
ncbi:MAG: NrsF family protein [Aestuariivirga sp.]